MKKKVDFIEGGTIQLCEISKGEIFASGVSVWTADDDCNCSQLTGQTIAYYKAMRDLAKQERKILKKEIVDIENLETFLFPKKLQGRETDFVHERFERYLSNKYKRLNLIEIEIDKWDATLKDYVSKKKEMQKKIKDKFYQGELGRKSETEEG